jgi:AAA domain
VSDGLSFLIHGPSKTGKSSLADTAPAPRLVLDAEGGNGSRWTPSKKTTWDPNRDNPPEVDGSWDTCIVNVRDYQTVQRAFDWLNSGAHPFKSVTIDSVSETQQRAIDALRGTDPMQTQDWGTLLRQMSKLIRDFRDLINHPTNPMSAVLFIAMTRQDGSGCHVPYVQGQLATVLPYQVDVLGYLTRVPDPNQPGVLHRYLMLQPDPGYLSGERVGGRLGGYVHVPDHQPTVTTMLSTVFGAEGDTP